MSSSALVAGAFVLIPVQAAATAAGNDTVGFSTLVVQLGLSGIFLWQWRSERDQRQKRDDQVIAILEQQGPVLAQAVNVLKAVQDSQKAVVTKSATDWDDIAGELRRITNALDEDIGKRRG